MTEKILRVATAVAACSLACAAAAQNYPAKPVRVIVPFPPAGAADIVARHASNALSEAFGVQFVVENRSGAGGAIGGEAAARATPDGYTLLMASSSTMSINPHFAAKQSYDPQTSFSPVILVGYATNVVAVHPSVPVRTIKELIALAKAQPGKITMGSAGVGTGQDIAAKQFEMATGVKVLHVPYKGGAPALNDLLGGVIQSMFETSPTALQYVTGNKLRGLAITSDKRSPLLPNLPTVAEAGVPGYESVTWIGLVAPAGTPKAIVDRINADLNKALAADMGDLTHVRRLASELNRQFEHIDVLAHNAGALTAQRIETPQGIESTVATHVVGPFLLTNLVLDTMRHDTMRRSASARVITMS